MYLLYTLQLPKFHNFSFFPFLAYVQFTEKMGEAEVVCCTFEKKKPCSKQRPEVMKNMAATNAT
jgi:hypothetical protein